MISLDKFKMQFSTLAPRKISVCFFKTFLTPEILTFFGKPLQCGECDLVYTMLVLTAFLGVYLYASQLLIFFPCSWPIPTISSFRANAFYLKKKTNGHNLSISALIWHAYSTVWFCACLLLQYCWIFCIFHIYLQN